jgi:radical SAM superfamily enzyme YgiQ (UPF0313 family)
MHTATRLAGPLIVKARAMNPSARICTYGLYAPLNEQWLRSLGADDVFGGEFEDDLVEAARSLAADPARPKSPAPRPSAATRQGVIPRLKFVVPDRSGLPPLERYATLQLPDGGRRVVGYTEASRGCRHLCRHCPIVPVYNGQFRIVPPEIVLGDVDAQVAAGARHVTFGDPDFFNGPAHAMRVAEALHGRHPDVSYDVTIKIEHLLRHRDLLPRLSATGCAFVTSAVESLDDLVLEKLAKGHTRADFFEAVEACREASLTLVPTFVAFHPWLTLEGYCDLLDAIERLDVIEHVAPIQLAIRLLIPRASRLLEDAGIQAVIGRFDEATLSYRWTHPDPRVDRLHERVSGMIGARTTADRRRVFDAISDLAHEAAGLPRAGVEPRASRATIPYLNEPWYC